MTHREPRHRRDGARPRRHGTDQRDGRQDSQALGAGGRSVRYRSVSRQFVESLADLTEAVGQLTEQSKHPFAFLEQRRRDGDQLADLLPAELHTCRRLTQPDEPLLRRHPGDVSERVFPRVRPGVAQSPRGADHTPPPRQDISSRRGITHRAQRARRPPRAIPTRVFVASSTRTHVNPLDVVELSGRRRRSIRRSGATTARREAADTQLGDDTELNASTRSVSRRRCFDSHSRSAERGS